MSDPTETDAVEITADESAAEPKAETPNTDAETAADEGGKEEVQEERTFTQAELDAAIQKRLLKEERRVHRRVEQQLREAAQKQQASIEPRREAFSDDDQYIRAHIEHIATQRAEALMSEREQRQKMEERNEAFLAKAEKAVERYPDFDAVVGNPTLRITDGMAEFIADSEVGAELAYHLGKHPGEAARIANLSPFRAARELATIERDLATKPSRPKASNAPDPINPVGNRGRASTSAAPSDDDDVDTWMRKERARLAAR